MPLEVFGDFAATTVSSGGTTAPLSGSTETWTVASSALFPASSNSAVPPTGFHVADPSTLTELIAVTNVSGVTWTVTRGAEGTPTIAHAAGFTVWQVVSAGAYGAFASVAGPANFGWALTAGVSALTDAATIAVNAAAGNTFPVTLGGNRTLGNPSSPASWQRILVPVTQPASGGPWTLSYGTAYEFTAGLPSPTLSTAANATDLLMFIYNPGSSKWVFTSFLPGV